MKRRTIWISSALALALASGATAQFFSIGPQLVFDPTAAAHLLTEISQIAQEYDLLMRTYQSTENTYNVLLNASNMLKGKGSWRYIMMPMMYPSSTNVYGTSGGWIGTLNTGASAVQAYDMAAMRMSSPYGLWSSLSAAGQGGFASHYATIELRDGLAQNLMTTTGTSRSMATQQANGISALEASTLSDADGDNTEVAVLNKISSATLIHAQTAQGTNQLLSAMADAQAVEMKAKRDVLVDEMNSAISAQSSAATTNTSIWGGTAAAFSARIP